MIINHHSIILQKGEPDIKTAAKIILNDFQRGKIPYYVRPPGSDDYVVSVKFLTFCSTAMRASIYSVFFKICSEIVSCPLFSNRCQRMDNSYNIQYHFQFAHQWSCEDLFMDAMQRLFILSPVNSGVALA